MADPNELIDLANALDQALKGEGNVTAEALIEARGPDIVAGLRMRAIEAAAWQSEWVLRAPVEVLGETYDRFSCREPNAEEYLKFGFFDSAVTGEKMMQLIAAVVGKPLPVIKKLPAYDVAQMSGRIGRFFASAVA